MLEIKYIKDTLPFLFKLFLLTNNIYYTAEREIKFHYQYYLYTRILK